MILEAVSETVKVYETRNLKTGQYTTHLKPVEGAVEYKVRWKPMTVTLWRKVRADLKIVTDFEMSLWTHALKDASFLQDIPVKHDDDGSLSEEAMKRVCSLRPSIARALVRPIMNQDRIPAKVVGELRIQCTKIWIGKVALLNAHDAIVYTIEALNAKEYFGASTLPPSEKMWIGAYVLINKVLGFYAEALSHNRQLEAMRAKAGTMEDRPRTVPPPPSGSPRR